MRLGHMARLAPSTACRIRGPKAQLISRRTLGLKDFFVDFAELGFTTTASLE